MMTPIRTTFLVLVILFASIITVNGQPITSKEIDVLVERTLKAFDVPGIAVAVVKDGKVIHAKGYGISSLNTKKKVDENTLFGIASNSKAFTAAAVGILVDEGKVKWDDKVIDYIPEFRLYNSYVTEDFTIKDLMTHRSGLGLGAGDLMFWPDSNNFTKKDIIYNLRFLKQVSAFRTKYDYDNLLYMVAGEVIARVSGKSWEEFIETRIMKPLQMNNSAASFKRIKGFSNVIDPHVPVDGKLCVIPRDESENMNAAGGIYSSINDLSKWVIMQMNHGKFGEGLKQQIFSTDVSDEMWTPQTIIPVRGTNSYNTHFGAYGLGWFLSDVKGFKQASHTGGLAGIVTQVTLIPELQLGIIVLTNQQSGAAFTSITNQIKDSYLGVKGIDRVKENSDRMNNSNSEAEKIVSDVWKTISDQQKNPSGIDPNPYVGTYRDNWFGNITIRLENGKMLFNSIRSPHLAGELLYYKGNTFVVKWFDRSFDADAFVMFGLNYEGKPTTIKMKAFSPTTDFSYDFHDLDFTRVGE
jgi:CubicO group peptidase (beta-lactamase class C family)